MHLKKHKKRYILIAMLLIFVALGAWILWENNCPELNYITVQSENLPNEFSGYRIAHVSDVHNADMVEDLIKLLKKAKPDIIAITGDLVDSYNPDIPTALSLIKEAVDIAPCYYVKGNHDSAFLSDKEYWNQLSDMGVIILEDECVTLTKDGAEITLIGINDPVIHQQSLEKYPLHVDEMLSNLTENRTGFTLLLSHRPDFFAEYAKNRIDLTLTGHAHGGQFRIPFVGGLYAPGQGIFPEYDSGLYKKDSSQMIVSRGIGNSGFPFRFNNRPEIILVQLQCG